MLQFDHVRGTKLDTISRMIRIGAGLDKIGAEIAKCEVRCANCHVIATLGRLKTDWRSRTLIS